MSRTESYIVHSKISFGVDAFEPDIKQALKLFAQDSSDAVLVICRPALIDLMSSLCQSELKTPYKVVSQRGEPSTNDVDKILSDLADLKVGMVIGVGGGSVLDAAKICSGFLGSGYNSFADFYRAKDVLKKRVRLILCPTTSGTGSELSYGAIVNDSLQPRKFGVRGELLAPDLAIVDPKFTFALPKDVSIETGFDCLTHAVESYCSLKSTVPSRQNSVSAIRAMLRILPEFNTGTVSNESRVLASFHSMMMGVNLANSSTCLPHRLQYTFAFETSASHAGGLAAVYPGWLAHISRQPIFSQLNDELGTDLHQGILKLFKQLGLSHSLKELGVSSSPVELAAKIEGNLALDPCYADGVVLDILKEIYG